MSKKIVLDVPITRTHIRSSVQKDARKCAIARAIVESDPDIFHANVTTDFITVARHSNERVTKYRTPRPARNFVIAFDSGRAPRPFELVVVDDDFVSERPRQMRQTKQAAVREARRKVAKMTGRKISEVKPDEPEVIETLKPFTSSGFTSRSLKDRVKKPSKPRTATRTYAKRETAADVLRKQDLHLA